MRTPQALARRARRFDERRRHPTGAFRGSADVRHCINVAGSPPGATKRFRRGAGATGGRSTTATAKWAAEGCSSPARCPHTALPFVTCDCSKNDCQEYCEGLGENRPGRPAPNRKATLAQTQSCRALLHELDDALLIGDIVERNCRINLALRPRRRAVRSSSNLPPSGGVR
jgi:hypothetical protein